MKVSAKKYNFAETIYLMLKKSLLPLLCPLFPFFVSAQTEWEVLNPKPSYKTGRDIEFVSEMTGYIINENELLETTTAGAEWHFKQILYGATDIDFKDNIGYIVGNNGYVLKSTDSGATWYTVETGFTQDLYSVSIVNADHIVLSGTTKIIKTEDGGVVWNILNLPTNISAETVTAIRTFFTSPTTGHVVCKNGLILKTIDGGESWYVTEDADVFPSDFFTIYFVNENLGFASREHDNLFRTADGGETWTLIEDTAISQAIYSFSFTNDQIGYASGEHGAMYKTTNGGTEWQLINFLDGYIDYSDMNGVYFTDATTGYATGQRGRIIKTVNGGNSWSQYAPFYNDVQQVSFIDESTAYAVIDNDFYKSEDSGQSWQLQGSLENIYNATRSFEFINENTAYAIAGEEVYKTLNGGQSWTPLGGGWGIIDEGIYSMDFIDSNIGYISGGYNQPMVKKTTDGGETWQTLSTLRLIDLQFFNEQTGFARSTYSGKIYKTTDGGQNWDLLFEIDDDIKSLHFVNETVGYFVGDPGINYKTTDGGQTWVQMEMSYEYFIKVRFYTPDVGYCVADYGNLYKTIDGGATWQYLNNIAITNFYFQNGDVYAYGTFGKILRADTGVLNASDNFEVASEIVLYPNPAKDKLQISYNGNSSIQNVTILDVTGRKILSKDTVGSLAEINLPQNLDGIYVASITLSNGANLSKKIVVK